MRHPTIPAPRVSPTDLLERALAAQPATAAAGIPSDPLQQIPESLFGDNPAVAISGTSGSGKSNTLEIILRNVVRSAHKPGLFFIDPHGTSARKFYRWCLDQGKDVRQRVLYLHFADTRKIPSIDVLHVPGDDVGSVAWYGRLAFITEIVSKIQLAAWGETDFNSRPVLFKNAFRVLYTLAHAGLPLSDAKLFADVHDPLYLTLCQAVPDVLAFARREMETLPDLKSADLTAQLDSWRNRTFGLLSNPVFEAVVGRTAADGALTLQQIYDDRLIVIVNLEQGGVLRQMDQEILANVLLTQAIFTAMSTPEEHRHLHVLAVDELPVFKSSADLLTTVALPQCRKYLLRTIACFQGTCAFPDGSEDRLLQAFLSLAGTRLYFRHNSEADCTFFGRAVAMPTYSPLFVKYEHSQPMQFQDGHEIRELVDTSDTLTEGDTHSQAQAKGSNKVSNWNQSTGRGDVDTFLDAVYKARADIRAESRTRQQGRGGAEGTTHQDTKSQAHSTSRAKGITRKQQLVPIVQTRDIITSVTFFQKEELDALGAAIIARLPVGQAILHVSGQAPVQVTFPYAADPFRRTPKFGRQQEADHQALLHARPAFATFEEIQDQRRRFLHALLRRLTDIALERGALAPPEILDQDPDGF